MTCRWTSSVRVLDGRHGELADDPIHVAACAGCEPCKADHCASCGYRHLDRLRPNTCATCQNATASDIRSVAAYAQLLPDQAVRGQNPTTRSELAIPGGDALVMLVEGSEHATGQRARHGIDVGPAAYSYQSDPTPPLLTLATWEDDWRHVLGMPAGGLATIASTTSFLLEHLAWAAQQHPAWQQFADEMRDTVTELEVVLHAGERDDLGPPCLHCTKPPRLRRAYAHPQPGRPDQGGQRDDWVCPKCRMTYDQDSYSKAEEQFLRTKRAENPWVLAHHVADLLERPVKTIRTWANRTVVRHLRDERGRLLVHWGDTRLADLRAQERAALARTAAERRAKRRVERVA